jgi:hypothetical protein
MLFWKDVCPSDQKRLDAISILYRKHPDLLFFLFELGRPRLKLPSECLKEHASVFSSGKELLVRLGLDLWDGSGNALFREIHQTLDSANFQNALNSLIFLRKEPNLGLPNFPGTMKNGHKNISK